MEFFLEFVAWIWQSMLDLNVRISLAWLFSAYVLAFGVWFVTVRRAGDSTSFLAFVFPKWIYRHRSNLLDIKLFLFNRFLGFIGITGALIFTPFVAIQVMDLLMDVSPRNWASAPQTWGRVALATLLIVMAADFCKYWAHRLHHESSVLWPFHAVHHSAEVMTPITLSRAHPMESVIRNVFISIVEGIVQALVVWLLVGTVSPWTIAGANAFYFMFNSAGANLRHSHIWVRFGWVAEHIFISPAQHQIHHSSATKHFNKNYGSMFAIWDWAFGTLYIPPHREDLTFGVADEHGTLLDQPYPTLRAALFNPFIESWRALVAPRADKDTSKPMDAITFESTKT